MADRKPPSDPPAPSNSPSVLPSRKPPLSNGQSLSTPSLSVQLLSYYDTIRQFLGLYFVSLFAVSPSFPLPSATPSTSHLPCQPGSRPASLWRLPLTICPFLLNS